MQNRTGLDLPGPVVEFSRVLAEVIPDVEVEIDRPADARGEWWIDIARDGFRSSVAWRPGHGFGVFTSPPSFGEKPDEVYRPPALAAKRLGQLADQQQNSVEPAPLWLNEIRQLCNTPQTSLAEKLSRSQASISTFERREDIRISSLRSYLEAMGGRLEMRVVFDDFSANVEISPNKKQSIH
jgi:hypothetical protein